MNKNNLLIIGAIIIIVVLALVFGLKGKNKDAGSLPAEKPVSITVTEQNETENARSLAIELIDSTDWGSPIKKTKITRITTPVQLPAKYNQGDQPVFGTDVSFEVTPEDVTKFSLAGNGEISGDKIINLSRSITYTKITDSEGKSTYTVVGFGTEPTELSVMNQ